MKIRTIILSLLPLAASPVFAQQRFAFGLNGQFAYDFISMSSTTNSVKHGSFVSQLAFAPGVNLRYSWNPYWNMELGADLMPYVSSYHADFPNGNASSSVGITSPRLLYMVNFKAFRKDSKYISFGLGLSYQFIPGGGGNGSMSVEGTAATGSSGAPVPAIESVSDSSGSSSIQVVYPNFAVGFGKEFKSGSELAIRINYQYGYKTLMEDVIKASSDGNSYNADIKNKGTYLSLGLYYTFRPIGSRRKAKAKQG